ncbi:MAG: sigma-54 dependent transcriptional regulator [Phycisphaeraceae bacterium]|nr:sigma-54 dependent transcriptional regulator [Phycisphaeraceae bacterium]
MSDGLVIALALDPPLAAQLTAVCDGMGVATAVARQVSDVDDEDAARGLWVCPLERFDEVRRRWALAPVIVTAHVADSSLTIDAMKRGAVDCLMLPVSDEELRSHIDDALQVVGDVLTEALSARSLPGADDGIIGQSPAMQQVYKLVGLVSPRDVNVLITGESGTGKEVIAKAVHRHSPRHDQPFLAVNCAAIPDTLLESELFGHERGAFTGADHRKIGKFEQAHGGTLFLDEIGDMPLATQVKLLRVLQERTFQRLGGKAFVECDVRIVTATHQPLEQLIATKAFRQDLYYRLKVASIHLPPLRDREVDTVLLAHYFVARFNDQFNTQIRTFSPEAVRALLLYDWPGNVRELENTIKASLLVARGGVFRMEFLPEHVRTFSRDALEAETQSRQTASTENLEEALCELADRYLNSPEHRGNAHRQVIGHVERVLITEALKVSGGRLQAAADLLGISRTTLRSRMRKHRIKTRVTAVSGD